MSDPTANFATPRMASAALFVNGDRVFLVHKTYANGWDDGYWFRDASVSATDMERVGAVWELGIPSANYGGDPRRGSCGYYRHPGDLA